MDLRVSLWGSQPDPEARRAGLERQGSPFARRARLDGEVGRCPGLSQARLGSTQLSWEPTSGTRLGPVLPGQRLPQKILSRGTQAEGGSQVCAQGAVSAQRAARTEPRRAARSAGTPGSALCVCQGGTGPRAPVSALSPPASASAPSWALSLSQSLPQLAHSRVPHFSATPQPPPPATPTRRLRRSPTRRLASGQAGKLCPALRAPPTGRATGTPMATCPPSASALHDAQTLPRAALHPKLQFRTHPELLACRSPWGAQETVGATLHPWGSRLDSLPRGTGQR